MTVFAGAVVKFGPQQQRITGWSEPPGCEGQAPDVEAFVEQQACSEGTLAT
jgi:hypothetical protein